ncbi:MAG: aspartate--tRNA ligase, partial [Microlunatus sp.]|nr:aspartate--tRNA ligase [Microlunatus sp.]
MIRTHGAGTLRAEQAGQSCVLAGWVARRRDHGGVAFVDLRDATGVAQVVIRDEVLAAGGAHDLRNEFCVAVTGMVERRPEGNANPDLPTGEIELAASAIEVLNSSAPLPFQIDERVSVGEEARLKYRYLDLRRPAQAQAIRLRSKVNQVARTLLAERDFVEIETPTLTRSTPEGARDFLVPARLQPGSWYALPQSPQLFKQLLMVAGMERYFQIARCYRDEDFRADRQPEFTQLDVEMSFVDQDDVIELSETLITAIWALIDHRPTTPFARMTYADAMERYGTDKPDLRFASEITDLTAFFADTGFRVFQADYVGALVMPGGADQPRRTFDAWQEFAKQRGHRGLAYVTIGGDGTLGGPVAKNLSETERSGLAAAVGAQPGDCVFFAAGGRRSAQSLLGATRLEVGRRCGLIDESAWSFLWVIDAPLFEPAGDAVAAGDVAVGSGAWTAVHHAFTSPKPESMETFDTDPGAALAYAYDLVCNGNEIAGGSIRIHRRDIQERVFAVM